MKKMYKYKLEDVQKQVIKGLQGRIKFFGLDIATGEPTVWCEHDSEFIPYDLTVFILGTGEAVPKEAIGKYIGTTFMGVCVYHLFI